MVSGVDRICLVLLAGVVASLLLAFCINRTWACFRRRRDTLRILWEIRSRHLDDPLGREADDAIKRVRRRWW